MAERTENIRKNSPLDEARERRRAVNRRYYQANKERIAALYQVNRDFRLASDAAYREANRDRRREYDENYNRNRRKKS